MMIPRHPAPITITTLTKVLSIFNSSEPLDTYTLFDTLDERPLTHLMLFLHHKKGVLFRLILY